MAGYDEEMMDTDRPSRARSASGASGKKQKGRGFREESQAAEDRFRGGSFESLPAGTGAGPAKSVEGWVLMVTGVHEEAQEEDLHEAFAEHGDVRNIHLNLDRRTGFVKGYALIEYATKQEAQSAIDALNGTELLTQVVTVTWAFSSGPKRRR